MKNQLNANDFKMHNIKLKIRFQLKPTQIQEDFSMKLVFFFFELIKKRLDYLIQCRTSVVDYQL